MKDYCIKHRQQQQQKLSTSAQCVTGMTIFKECLKYVGIF